jgi:hypothetical protein
MDFRAHAIPSPYKSLDPHFEQPNQPRSEAPENSTIGVPIEDERIMRRIRGTT